MDVLCLLKIRLSPLKITFEILSLEYISLFSLLREKSFHESNDNYEKPTFTRCLKDNQKVCSLIVVLRQAG